MIRPDPFDYPNFGDDKYLNRAQWLKFIMDLEGLDIRHTAAITSVSAYKLSRILHCMRHMTDGEMHMIACSLGWPEGAFDLRPPEVIPPDQLAF